MNIKIIKVKNINKNQPNIYNDEIITLSQAIELIRQSVRNEREDELFYNRLLEQAPQKNIRR